MTTHFLRKIDANGLFVEDVFFDDGEVVAVPGTPLMQENSDGSFSQAIDDEGKLEWHVAPVEAVPPKPIPANLIATPVPEGFGHPRWNGSAWIEGRDPVVLAAQRQAIIDAQAAESKFAADSAIAKSNPKLSALAGMSKAQIDTYFAANVTNLAQCIDTTKTLAYAVSILARRL